VPTGGCAHRTLAALLAVGGWRAASRRTGGRPGGGAPVGGKCWAWGGRAVKARRAPPDGGCPLRCASSTGGASALKGGRSKPWVSVATRCAVHERPHHSPPSRAAVNPPHDACRGGPDAAPPLAQRGVPRRRPAARAVGQAGTRRTAPLFSKRVTVGPRRHHPRNGTAARPAPRGRRGP